jgi:tRNA(Ile)-lysidine synthase
LRIAFVCHAERSEAPRKIRKSVRDGSEALRFAQGDRLCESFDVDVLGESPFIRTWREGDRFQPLGMRGEKKLQDFFVDEKVPRRQRGRVPLLCAADGRIVWVVGCRIAEPFKVTDATRRVVRIRVEKL